MIAVKSLNHETLQNVSRNIQDQKILKAIQQEGNLEYGFRILMATYSEKLYWSIRRLVLDHEDANDVLQNCLVKVYKNIRRFKGQSSLYTWLYRIAINESITFLKKKKKSSTTSIEDQDINLSNKLEADPYFDGDYLQKKLHQILDQLPEKQRLVFNMRYFEDLTYKQISDILNTSVGALKASYHHAVRKIESRLREGEVIRT